MIQNYLKIAWRNLIKHKVFSVINIAGLSIGIAACTIIFLYVQHELGYDQFNSKADRIVRITSNLKSPDGDLLLATGPALLTSTLKREMPEVEEAVRFVSSPLAIIANTRPIRESDIFKTDPAIFKVFDFEFVEGSPENALDNPNSLVISQSLAKKYFGNEKAVGKSLQGEKNPLIITAVFKDRPTNADMKIAGLHNGFFDKQTKWLDDLNHYTFVLFRNPPDFKKLSTKLAAISAGNLQKELNGEGATSYKLLFTPELLKDVHFSKGKLGDMQKGERQYSLIFSMLAIFILLIALLNYINLTTARSFERAREIGIRKVVGAHGTEIIRQFLFESFVLIIISWALGNLLVRVGLPFVNKLLDTELTISWAYTLLFTTGVLIVSFILAGFYPALVMSSYKPVTVLKGRWQRSFKGLWLRKTVIVVQFAIAAALIMGTITIYKQMNLLRNRNLGYNNDHLLAVNFPGDSTIFGSIKVFQDELRKRPEILGSTVGNRMGLEGLGATSTTVQWNGKKKEFMCNFYQVDNQYIPVMQMKLVEGRNFSDTITSDKAGSVIVNEAFLRSMGWKSAVGKEVSGFGEKPRAIIGVVKDYAYKSLHNMIEPLILVQNDTWFKTVTMRIQPQHLPVVEGLFRQHFPSLYFDYQFVDEMVNQYYKQDAVTMSLFNQFTGLGIFVSCLGLYGLVSLVTAQRSKEIGVRKVLGATLISLFNLLTRDFILLVLVSLAVALPLTAIAMNSWLNGYAYHVQLSWREFLLPVVATVVIALLVVSREVLRAALVNPVQSLKAD